MRETITQRGFNQHTLIQSRISKSTRLKTKGAPRAYAEISHKEWLPRVAVRRSKWSPGE
jgi:hypothetical protein